MNATITGDNDDREKNNSEQLAGKTQETPDGTLVCRPDGTKYRHNEEQNEAAKGHLNRAAGCEGIDEIENTNLRGGCSEPSRSKDLLGDRPKGAA